jgi:hypothetical protein
MYIVWYLVINCSASSTFRTKVKEILESFSTLNELAVVSHVYAYFMPSRETAGKNEFNEYWDRDRSAVSLWRESWNCGVYREIMVWIMKLWSESRIFWRVSCYCGAISLFVACMNDPYRPPYYGDETARERNDHKACVTTQVEWLCRRQSTA